eukprot:1156636-Pelagomonas_calceolata.AAC.19
MSAGAVVRLRAKKANSQAPSSAGIPPKRDTALNLACELLYTFLKLLPRHFFMPHRSWHPPVYFPQGWEPGSGSACSHARELDGLPLGAGMHTG